MLSPTLHGRCPPGLLRRRSATAAWIYAAVALWHRRDDRRGARARPRGLRRVRDRARRRRLLPDPPRPHGRGVAHEVRVPLRRRPGLGAAAAALPAGLAAQGRRRSTGHARRRRARAVRGRDLRLGGRRVRRCSRRRCSRSSSRRRTSASTALLLHSRYDLRGVYQAGSAALRLLAIVIAAPLGVTEALVAIVVAQAHRDRRHLVRRARRAASVPGALRRASSARTSLAFAPS